MNRLSRYGANWTEDEKAQLLAAFDSGALVEELVAAHQRTAGALVGKLSQLGRLIYLDRTRAYHRISPVPFATEDQIKNWALAEKDFLSRIEDGLSIEDLAGNEAGSEMAIFSRLVSLGYLHRLGKNYFKAQDIPYMTYQQLQELNAKLS